KPLARFTHAAVVAIHGRCARADAHLHNYDDRIVSAGLRELSRRFLENRGVPIDNPAGDLLVTFPRSIGYDDTLITGLLGRSSYSLVVCSIDDLHLGAFVGNRIDPRLRSALRNKDDRLEPEPPSNQGDCSPMAPVGSCRQASDLRSLPLLRAELVYVVPLIKRASG